MTKVHWGRLEVVACAAFCVALLAPRAAAAQSSHLWWAEQLIDNVSPANNVYDGDPSYITWAGVDGATRYANRTYCNSFFTQLGRMAYGWTDADLTGWLGSTSPSAVVYHDAIAGGNGFTQILTVDRVSPGDIIAISYPDGAGSSGHVAIVKTAPAARTATDPIISRTKQFELWVADSSHDPHGTSDTRVNPDGTSDTGAGFGVMRLYTDRWLRVVGYTWSTLPSSLYRAQSSYDLVIGRLQ